jgi:putative hydrolase of the HAD superfamily
LLRSVLRANNLEKLFDFVIISSEVRVAKPNKEIFINLTEVADVQATSVIFIDDNPENVKVATDLAMTAILFTDTSSLDTCLSGLLT